jgi:serine protease Do
MSAASLDMIVASERLGHDLAALAETLRRSTVLVHGLGRGAGSGVIWSPDGLIITNAHVARGPGATIETADGRTFKATVTARDASRDLAAVKVEASGLPPAPVGDSGALRAGELALAVGNPLGLKGALTLGVIHSADRRWVRAAVRLAPGNSGGPLADARGRVVGINSLIAGGLALAVPSGAVQSFLRADGRRPALGVMAQPVRAPSEKADAIGLLALEIKPQSPAAAAGLLIGDVITGVNGRRFRSPADLAMALQETAPGGVLRLDAVRGGRPIIFDVVVDGGKSLAEAA